MAQAGLASHQQETRRLDLRRMFIDEGERLRDCHQFRLQNARITRLWRGHLCPGLPTSRAQADELLDRAWDRMVSIYGLSQAQRPHLRNHQPGGVAVCGFATAPRRDRRFRRVPNVQATIWKMRWWPSSGSCA